MVQTGHIPDRKKKGLGHFCSFFQCAPTGGNFLQTPAVGPTACLAVRGGYSYVNSSQSLDAFLINCYCLSHVTNAGSQKQFAIEWS